MESSLSLQLLLPALRSVARVDPAGDRRHAIIIERPVYQGVPITSEGIGRLLSATGATIVATTIDSVTVELPDDSTVEQFIQLGYDNLLQAYQPRHLTPDEIASLLEAVPEVRAPIQKIGQRARDEIIARLADQLSEITITPLGIPDLQAEIIRRFERARIDPGETVGLSVAEGLSALTQATLKAFHQTGSRSNMSAGMEMLQDLLAVRVERKMEASTIHFWDFSLTFDQVFDKRPSIVAVTVGDIVKDYSIGSPDDLDAYWWLGVYPALSGRPLPTSSSVLQLTLHIDRLVTHDVTIDALAEVIRGYNLPDIITVIAGPIDSGIMLIYPNEELVVEPLRKNKIPIDHNIGQTFLSEIVLPTLSRIHLKGLHGIKSMTPTSVSTWSLVQRQTRGTGNTWILHISRFVQSRDGIPLDKLTHLLTTLNFVLVETTPTYVTVIPPGDLTPAEEVSSRISEADAILEQERRDRLGRRSVTPNTAAAEISYAGRYVYASTVGSNLTGLYGRPDVDTTRTICNNPHTVLRLLGIEAARNMAISEFIYILETSGLQLDPRHIGLLADFMTNRGVLLPISFWGMVRSKLGPLTVASFGKAITIFRTAAAFGESEKIRTTASAMYVGRRSQIGTGYVDLQIDEAKIEEYTRQVAPVSIGATDLAAAVAQLDNLTFGAEPETPSRVVIGMAASNPLDELAALGRSATPVAPTILGTGTISRPVETVGGMGTISTMVERVAEGIEVASTLQVSRTVVTTRPLPPRITIPRPTRLSGSAPRAPSGSIPRARIESASVLPRK